MTGTMGQALVSAGDILIMAGACHSDMVILITTDLGTVLMTITMDIIHIIPIIIHTTGIIIQPIIHRYIIIITMVITGQDITGVITITEVLR